MTPPLPATPTNGLRNRLPAISVQQAAASRLAFDARFERWLRRAWGGQTLSVQAPGRQTGLALELHARQGVLHLSVDTSAWPALQAAADLPDRAMADAVLTALLQPVLAPLQAVCGAVRVQRADSAAPAAVATVHGANNVALALSGCSAELAAHIRLALPGLTRPDMWRLAPLRMQGRLVLMTRKWNAQVLSTLACGDLVLPPAGPAALARWRLGVGRGPNWPVRINMKERTVHIESPQQPPAAALATGNKPVSPAEPAGPALRARSPVPGITEGPPAAWSTLELPVNFELDTARISLLELAALRPGSAIELDQPLDEAVVRLVCQGQTLGEGQLVAIGERLGVRITRMGLAHAATERA
jgi:type III secretion protein Q